MKTIRGNCFETNSSSTHSLTVHAPSNLDLKPAATFLPDESGKISITIGQDTDYESCLQDKLNFALTFAHTLGDQEGYDRVVRVVESFTNIPLDVKCRRYDSEAGKYVTEQVTSVVKHDLAEDADEEEREEAASDEMEDMFGSYTGDYGHGSVSDFIEEGKKVIASDQSILVFIFSNHCGFSRESHYDG